MTADTRFRPFPYNVVLNSTQIKKHMDTAKPLAERITAELARSTNKPFDEAIACHIVLSTICKEFGWYPRHFEQWVEK